MAALLSPPVASTTTIVTLKNLKLSNFKGIKSLNLDFTGNASIYGANGLGKTTIADAWFWLFFGKDSANRADFEIKTLLPDGQPEHRLLHEVEATIDVDGQLFTFRKVYQEDWKTQRGAAAEAFTSHTTDHYVNGVPCSMAEYKRKVSEICSEQTFRLVSDPSYFNKVMNWKDRRNLLLEVCGDITDNDVIAAHSQLADLPGILKGRSIEDHKKVAAAEKKQVDEEIKHIPQRIDEVNRALPVIDFTAEGIAALEQTYNQKRTDLQAELSRIDNGAEVTEKRRQITQIDTEILSVKNRQSADLAERQRQDQSALNALQAKGDEASRKVRLLKTEISDTENDAVRYLSNRDECIKAYDLVEAEVFTMAPMALTCPSCDQPIPEDRLEEVRKKAQEEFNLSKSTRLEKVRENGKKAKLAQDACLLKIEDLKAKLIVAEEESNSLAEQIGNEKSKLEAARSSVTVDTTAVDSEIAKLNEQKAGIEQSITALLASTGEEQAKIRNQILEVNDQINGLATKKAHLELYAKSVARVDDLKAQEKKLSGEKERIARELFLIEEFIRAKVAMLTDRINSRFSLVKFKLFDTQVNGGIEECCVCTVDGVPFDGNLNTGNKINAGLDVINSLSRHYGFTSPVFIDNAESVTDILATHGQQIRLVVSKPDQTLRFEAA